MSVSRFVVFSVFAFTASVSSAWAEETSPVPSSPEMEKIAKAFEVCRAQPDLQRCDRILALANDVDWVTKTPVATTAVVAQPQTVPPVAAPATTTATSPTSEASEEGIAGHPAPAQVKFAVSSDTKTASVTWSKELPATGDSSRVLSFSVQTPVGQGSTYQNVATLDGLTKATTLGVQYDFITATLKDNGEVQNSESYQNTCRILLKDVLHADPSLEKKLQYMLTAPNCSADGMIAALKNSKVLTKSKREALSSDLKSLKEQTLPGFDHAWIVSLNGKYGLEQHTFFDATSLGKSSVGRRPYQVGVSFNYLPTLNSSIGAAVNYQRSYKDGDTAVLCPTAPTPVVKCINGFIGSPAKTDKYLVTLEYKALIEKSIFGIPMGLDPAISYDAKSGEYGFQFPIYLMSNASHYLTGGIRYDWTSAKHESIIGIFISSPFCIMPGKTDCSSGGSK